MFYFLYITALTDVSAYMQWVLHMSQEKSIKSEAVSAAVFQNVEYFQFRWDICEYILQLSINQGLTFNCKTLPCAILLI